MSSSGVSELVLILPPAFEVLGLVRFTLHVSLCGVIKAWGQAFRR